MRFLAVFLFLFSTAALASEVKLVCTISGKNFGKNTAENHKIIFDDSKKIICTGYPCSGSDIYKANETVSYVGYGGRENTNTVTSWSKELIEIRNYDGEVSVKQTLNRTSGVLHYVFINRNFEVRVNMKGPCKVVEKFDNEKPPKF
ncbi:hypothetical protein [Microbulbifer sp. TYP-18]|uniref:hypothetical protein n=1 Tax=Microbulbifer sp. TYP-18 TaxID=3230024 RepID=UPI0034C5D61B